MKIVLYTHSLVSDWNHGNAHFQRGFLSELAWRGHEVLALEPRDGWSRANLMLEPGEDPDANFATQFPLIAVQTYDDGFDHEAVLEDADVVIVHEWTDASLVAEIGRLRRAGGAFTLLFHDTHHRAVSDSDAKTGLLLADYDGVLAFGLTLTERYRASGWGRQVFTWHEAADIRRFHPMPAIEKAADLVWIGNWGDEERTRELAVFLIEPARVLGLTGTVHGVRYSGEALEQLRRSRLDYAGRLGAGSWSIPAPRPACAMPPPLRPVPTSSLGRAASGSWTMSSLPPPIRRPTPAPCASGGTSMRPSPWRLSAMCPTIRCDAVCVRASTWS